MSILTLADWKTYTGTTVATYDTFVTAALPVVQDQIENYCDRHFDSTNYYQWFSYDNYLVLPEWPMNNLLFIGGSDTVATIVITGTYTVEVFNTKVCVTDEALTTTTFLFSAYANITLLLAAITAAFATIVFTIQSGYATCPPQRLRTGLVTDTLYGAKQLTVGFRKPDLSNRILELGYDASYGFLYSLGESYDDVIYLAWNAGYAYADMPKGLQMVEANIIKDMVQNMTAGAGGAALNPFINSEEFTNYSYTTGNISFIIQYLRKEFMRYYDALEFYKKKEI
jgi:hypothetical protein